MESSEASKVFVRSKESKVHVERHTGWTLESVRVRPSWQFELLLWGISSGFPLISHLNLPGSESIFGVSQILSCVHTRFAQPRWIPPQRLMGSWRQLASFSFGPQGVFLRMCGQGRLLSLRMRVCGVGRAQPPIVTKSDLALFPT